VGRFSGKSWGFCPANPYMEHMQHMGTWSYGFLFCFLYIWGKNDGFPRKLHDALGQKNDFVG